MTELVYFIHRFYLLASGSRVGALTRVYFRSGWAFLIPYLAIFIIYRWQEWPANSSSSSVIPSLLHVFWVLHIVHVLLFGFTLLLWQPASSTPDSKFRQYFNQLWLILPWLGLGLLFYIPGIYLEWPTDPWEHLQRITEWSTHQTVHDHSAGYKSLYFLIYSIVGGHFASSQIYWLTGYTTLLCLLLAWQYYRLALSISLEIRWAFFFAILATVGSGSSCFSFSRYYALATSIIAQIGMVAMTRFAFELTKVPALDLSNIIRHSAVCVILLGLIAANHVQGLGMVILNAVSLGAWYLHNCRRTTVWWIYGALILTNAAVLIGWPRYPLLDEIYLPQGWLNVIGGFNFYTWRSPASERTIQILGCLGILNIFAAVLLLRRNHVIGWLTLGPLLWLSMPIVALPFSNMLASKGVDQIVAFHRMFFAIPAGLAFIICLRHASQTLLPDYRAGASVRWAIAMVGLLALVGLSPGWPTYNRFWNLIAVTPNDLSMKVILHHATQPQNSNFDRFLAVPAITSVLGAIDPSRFPKRQRLIGQPMAGPARRIVRLLDSSQPTPQGIIPEPWHDSLVLSPRTWFTHSGVPVEFNRVGNFYSWYDSVLQNQPGQASEVLTKDLLPIVPGLTYQIEVSIRQIKGEPSVTWLALAWYDNKGVFLPSFAPQPTGADSPTGWNNGTFSYFGEYTAKSTSAWTIFRVSFGNSEQRKIPVEARFIRIGALINTRQTPNAVVQLTNIRLWHESSELRLLDGVYTEDRLTSIFIPDWRWLITPCSQAALFSQHWPPNQVASDFSAAAEIEAAIRRKGVVPSDLPWAQLPVVNLKPPFIEKL